MILLTDEEGRTMAKYSNPHDAAKIAEREGWYALGCRDVEGEIQPLPLFWYAELDLSTNDITTGKTDLYKWGSASQPCRHGISSPCGPIQRLGSIMAWAATESVAIRRVKRHAKEGRKRAARDQTWQRIETEVRKSNPDIFWDPYGLWIDSVPGLRDRLIKESAKAYRLAT